MVVYVAIYIACVYVYVLQGHMLILIIAHALLISLSCRPIAPSYTKADWEEHAHNTGPCGCVQSLHAQVSVTLVMSWPD